MAILGHPGCMEVYRSQCLYPRQARLRTTTPEARVRESIVLLVSIIKDRRASQVRHPMRLLPVPHLPSLHTQDLPGLHPMRATPHHTSHLPVLRHHQLMAAHLFLTRTLLEADLPCRGHPLSLAQAERQDFRIIMLTLLLAEATTADLLLVAFQHHLDLREVGNMVCDIREYCK